MRWFLALLLILAAAWAIDSGLLAYAAYVLLGVLLLTRIITRNGLNVVTAERECGPTEVEVGEQPVEDAHNRNPGLQKEPALLVWTPAQIDRFAFSGVWTSLQTQTTPSTCSTRANRDSA